MTHRCLDEQELAAIGSLPPADPRRRDASRCPRCDSLLQAMAAFLAGDNDLPAAEARQADARLAAFISQRMTAPPAAPVAAESMPASRRFPPRISWRWGAALATAATLVLLLGRFPERAVVPSGELRGGATGTDAAEALVLESPTRDPVGVLQLRWSPVAGADQYLVVLFSAGLDTLGVVGPVSDPAAAVGGPVTPDNGDRVFCRIQALAEGIVIAASRLQPLPRP